MNYVDTNKNDFDSIPVVPTPPIVTSDDMTDETTTPTANPAPASDPEPITSTAKDDDIDVSVNKGNIARRAIDIYDVTSGDIVNYLQNQLGFTVNCDFDMWSGLNGMGYIRMRLVADAKNVISGAGGKDYVDRFLYNNAAGYKIDERVINVLTPFMYPSSIVDILNNPEYMAFIRDRGIYGERLKELIQYHQLTYNQKANAFFVYLRAERIIDDILTSVKTNKIEGVRNITRVTQTSPGNYCWEVQIARNNSSISDVSIDAIFGTASNK